MRVEHARPYEERRRLQLEAMKDKRYRCVLLLASGCSETVKEVHHNLSTQTQSHAILPQCNLSSRDDSHLSSRTNLSTLALLM